MKSESSSRSHREHQNDPWKRRIAGLGSALALFFASESPSYGEEAGSEPMEDIDRESFNPLQKIDALMRFVREHPVGLMVNVFDEQGALRTDDVRWLLETITFQMGYPRAAEFFEIEVPYEFAPHFTETEAKDSREFQELRSEIIQALREAWMKEIVALPGSFYTEDVVFASDEFRDIIRLPWHQQGQLKIAPRVEEIRITGFASSEHALPDENFGIDQNEQLARLRADHAEAVVLQLFPYLGVDQLPKNFVVPAYSEEDMAEMIRLADELHIRGVGRERMMRLFEMYNKGMIEDQGQRQVLDRIIGDKRKVRLEVRLANGHQGTVLIPVPLLPLIAFGVLDAFFDRRQRRRQRAAQEQHPEPE